MGDHASDGRQALNAAGLPPAPHAASPPAASEEAIAQGRWLFAQVARFVAGAAAIEQIPPAGLPEVAFAGRSNVGKSSLINALTGQQRLAVTSSTPGRTRQINFFVLGERLMLADLPGYGYASAPKAQVSAWLRLVERYLSGRPSLRRVLLLVDGRHGLKPADEKVMDLLDRAAVSYQAVLTKCDKAAGPDLGALQSRLMTTLAHHPAAHPWVEATSARTGIGLAGVRAALAALADWRGDAGS